MDRGKGRGKEGEGGEDRAREGRREQRRGGEGEERKRERLGVSRASLKGPLQLPTVP